jgi:hypothetical protein
MNYKDVIAPSITYDKNSKKKIWLHYMEYRMVLYFLSLAGAARIYVRISMHELIKVQIYTHQTQ